MDSGEAALIIASVGMVAFLAFLCYNVMAMNREKTTVFVRDKDGNIVGIIEK